MSKDESIFEDYPFIKVAYEKFLEEINFYLESYPDEEIENAKVRISNARQALEKHGTLPDEFDFEKTLDTHTKILHHALCAQEDIEDLRHCLLNNNDTSNELIAEMALGVGLNMQYISWHNAFDDSGRLMESLEDNLQAYRGIQIADGSDKGRKNRHKPNKDLYSRALEIAKEKWMDGSTKPHHKMCDWLQDEYETKDREMPFTTLPKPGLLKNLRLLLREIDREDLIFGK